MAAEGTDWVSVCDGGRLHGWVGADELNGSATVADLRARPFAAVVGPDTTLKAALDVIVTSQTRVAVEIVEQMVDALRGTEYRNVLNRDE